MKAHTIFVFVSKPYITASVVAKGYNIPLPGVAIMAAGMRQLLHLFVS